MHKKSILIVFVAITLVFILSACGSKSPSVAESTQPTIENQNVKETEMFSGESNITDATTVQKMNSSSATNTTVPKTTTGPEQDYRALNNASDDFSAIDESLEYLE